MHRDMRLVGGTVIGAMIEKVWPSGDLDLDLVRLLMHSLFLLFFLLSHVAVILHATLMRRQD